MARHVRGGTKGVRIVDYRTAGHALDRHHRSVERVRWEDAHVASPRDETVQNSGIAFVVTSSRATIIVSLGPPVSTRRTSFGRRLRSVA